MAKKAVKPAETQNEPQAPAAQPTSGNVESVAGYFRPIFEQNPKLLKVRSNEELLQRWLDDHPGQTEVPERVKQGLANLKSLMRKKAGQHSQKQRAEPARDTAAVAQPRKLDRRRLEELEQQIDDALQAAKATDREQLANVIGHLRAARNLVVMQVGWE